MVLAHFMAKNNNLAADSYIFSAGNKVRLGVSDSLELFLPISFRIGISKRLLNCRLSVSKKKKTVISRSVPQFYL